MNQIQPIAAYVPYMVCAGNHEHAYNFSNYRRRFTMPGGDGEGIYYSFTIGPARVIAFSTEVYYFYQYGKYGWVPIVNQYSWLQRELQDANRPENRAKQPWVITVGHRPMYCSTRDGTGPEAVCNNHVTNRVRFGIPDLRLFGLEDLFYKSGVDLQFYGHEHNYERLWPIYNQTVCNGTKSAYHNPRAPVHIVTGAAGNEEGQGIFNPMPYPWTAYRSDDFGYMLMTLTNKTHIQLNEISVKKNINGEVIDQVTVVKDKHGAGLYDCHKHS